MYQKEEATNVVEDMLEPITRVEGWNYRTLNVQSKLPKALHAEARRRLKEMLAAPTRSESERLRKAPMKFTHSLSGAASLLHIAVPGLYPKCEKAAIRLRSATFAPSTGRPSASMKTSL